MTINAFYAFSVPHMSGTLRDDALVDLIRTEWLAAGLDHVQTISYEIYLSFPNNDQPNSITVSKGIDVVFDAKTVEDVGGNLDSAFLAYSANGSASGNIVYVNYATIEDFEEFETNITFVRYALITLYFLSSLFNILF